MMRGCLPDLFAYQSDKNDEGDDVSRLLTEESSESPRWELEVFVAIEIISLLSSRTQGSGEFTLSGMTLT